MARKTQQEKQKQKLINELLKDYDGPESFCGESGSGMKQGTKIINKENYYTESKNRNSCKFDFIYRFSVPETNR